MWQSSITNLGSNGVVQATKRNNDYLIFIVVSDEVNEYEASKNIFKTL